MRAVRTEIDLVQLRQQRQRRRPAERVARANDAVAGDRRQQMVDPLEVAARKWRPLGELGQHLAQERLGIGVLERLGEGVQPRYLVSFGLILAAVVVAFR